MMTVPRSPPPMTSAMAASGRRPAAVLTSQWRRCQRPSANQRTMMRPAYRLSPTLMNSEGWAVPMPGTSTQLQLPPVQVPSGVKTSDWSAVAPARTGIAR